MAEASLQAPHLAMPGFLDCSVILDTVAPGPTWNDLTIGISTKAEMIARLSDMNSGEVPNLGTLLFQTPDFPFDSHPIMVEACFKNERLAAMDVYDESIFPDHLDKFVARYGKPDAVTWADSYFNRSLIWADAGILADVMVEMDLVIHVILFSPIPHNKLANSWLLKALPPHRQQNTSMDLPSLPPDKDVEDPWGLTQH